MATAITAAGSAIFVTGYVAAVAFMANRAFLGEATVGDILLTITLAGTVNGIVASSVTMVSWFASAMKTVSRYLWLIDYADGFHEQARAATGVVPDRILHGIALRDVSFRYPGTDTDVLRNASVDLPADSTVAIVGDNGAGKSTLVKLLWRFYEPTSGTITLDGSDIADYPIDDWRRRTSAAFQDFAKLQLAAQESIGVGDLPRIDDPDAVHAGLERAHATDVLTALPDGLATQLGTQFEDGVELSGGQWQKLALARALLREDPLLVLLDEPTASLDAQTEHALFERYAAGARRAATEAGAITILVSHRFSTVRMADLILVIRDGGIAESGTHAQLMADGAVYAELYNLQANAFR